MAINKRSNMKLCFPCEKHLGENSFERKLKAKTQLSKTGANLLRQIC